MWKVLNATCNMQHATFLRQLAMMAAEMIYGTFQCKIWHFLVQTMAVCVFCDSICEFNTFLIPVIIVCSLI